MTVMIEYILLIFAFILPIWYRYFFWFQRLEKYKSFSFKRDKESIIHIFSILEIFILILSFTVLFQPAAEIIVFNLVFYYWLISWIFVIWKIVRWKIKLQSEFPIPFYLFQLLIVFWVIFESTAFIFTEFSNHLYYYLLLVLLLAPITSYLFMFIISRKIFMKKIAIISGWTGLERWIALKSAEFFKNNINKDYDFYVLPEELPKFVENKEKYNLVIPVFHWEYWEDGKIMAYLELLGLKYSFSEHATHALCLDKEKTNVLVYQLWIQVPYQYIAQTSESFPETYPVIMKPNHWGSSFHTYKIENHQDFHDNFNLTKKDISDDILIQQFIRWEEYSVPVVDWEVLPIMKLEKDENQLFDYESKYESEEIMKETFPIIEENLKSKLENDTLKIYNYFWIKWMCRIDYLVQDGEIYFLEINTIPWMTQTSILPKAWNLLERTNEELIQKIIK